MQIAARRYADTWIVAPTGRVDHLTAAQFEAGLMPLLAQAREARGSLVLDFSGVVYISSVGLRVLMIAASQMRPEPGQLLVASLQPVVAEIFAISRFDRVLGVAAALDEAIGRCSEAALAAYRQDTAAS